MYKKCPKCGYERQATDIGDAGVCPSCGLIFAKWVQRISGRSVRAGEPAEEDGHFEVPTFFDRLKQLMLHVPDRTDPIQFWGRVVFFVGIFVWGWYFILLDFRIGDIGESFMHRVNLAFHE